MGRQIKKLLGWFASIVLFITAGCALITPTIVPPLTNALGFNVPNIKGVTTVGIVKGALVVEREKLKVFDSMAHLTLTATEDAKNGIIDVVAMLGLGGSALLPMALRKVPSGAVSKDEHERRVQEAGLMNPDDFKS
jgi:hypothetical protein